MARNETFFLYADRGATSVYKFRFEGRPEFHVWFEYDGGDGVLFTTPEPGPYSVEHALEPAKIGLEELLAERATTKAQWIKDLMAQFGEPLAWTYP